MVKAEIFETLKTVRDPKTIQSFILRMKVENVNELLTCLMYVDEDTRNLWYGVYVKSLKGETV